MKAYMFIWLLLQSIIINIETIKVIWSRVTKKPCEMKISCISQTWQQDHYARHNEKFVSFLHIMKKATRSLSLILPNRSCYVDYQEKPCVFCYIEKIFGFHNLWSMTNHDLIAQLSETMQITANEWFVLEDFKNDEAPRLALRSTSRICLRIYIMYRNQHDQNII